MAEWRIVGLRERVRLAEERMDYFTRMMRERPNLYGIWFYWFHWYRVRRADFQTRLWLITLRSLKSEIQTWERLGTAAEHGSRAEIIRVDVRVIEDGTTVIRGELDGTRAEARARKWRIRFPAPYGTMTHYIRSVRRRFRTIANWIKRIREELPALWKKFVYVIYYAYTNPEAPRHIEAHMEGECHRDEKVQEKVKMLANKLLRLWVATPIKTDKGRQKPGYATPLLQHEMAEPPYEGIKTLGSSRWEWGVQWETKITEDGKLGHAIPKPQVKETQTLHFEVYDYDYGNVRMEDYYEVPAVWWELSQEQLENIILRK